jgi:hypothetical protein
MVLRAVLKRRSCKLPAFAFSTTRESSLPIRDGSEVFEVFISLLSEEGRIYIHEFQGVEEEAETSTCNSLKVVHE